MHCTHRRISAGMLQFKRILIIRLVRANRSHTYDTYGFNVNKNMIYLISAIILERRIRKTNAFNGHIQPSFKKPVLGANTSVKILGLLTVLANVCTCIYICYNVRLNEREFYSIFIFGHTLSVIILLYVFDKNSKTSQKHDESQYFFFFWKFILIFYAKIKYLL